MQGEVKAILRPAPPIVHRKAAAAAAKDRIAWLDAAKGVGIILVVIGHALGGIIDSQLGRQVPAFRAAFFALYSFHMPLFFMLAGVLVANRIDRDRGKFLRSMGRTIVWPYFLWSALQFTLIYALGQFVNAPAERYWATLASLPWHTVSQFWFLYALFLLHLAAWAWLPSLGTVAFLIIGLAFKPLMSIVPLPEVLRLAAQQAPYYALGVAFGSAGIATVVNDRPAWVKAVALPLMAAGLIGAAWIAEPSFNPRESVMTTNAAGIAFAAWQMAVFPAALAASFAMIGLSSLARGRVCDGLVFLGQRTMPIFVLHVMAIAGTRIVLVKLLHVGDPVVVLVVAVAAGVIAPLVAFTVFERLKIARVLGLA